ncbi:hypothetical protein M758_6G169100 [Ceratodon purpureus]|nr:hypothetical protein M758_6G169100 [Ceratodon purpureus]
MPLSDNPSTSTGRSSTVKTHEYTQPSTNTHRMQSNKSRAYKILPKCIKVQTRKSFYSHLDYINIAVFLWPVRFYDLRWSDFDMLSKFPNFPACWMTQLRFFRE